MEYTTAVELAPPGWRHFTVADAARLPAAVLRHEMARAPEGELALAERGDPAACERVRRALFWTFVYHLEPERWDALAGAEPVDPRLLAALPARAATTLDVGAGSGRLTRHLAARSDRILAVEPALGLARILARRLLSARVVSAWAEALPLPDGCVDLTAACGAFGPDPAILGELRRVTRPGGCIALVSPEEPEWFGDHGWSRVTVDPTPAPPHEAWIDEFFGPPHPPSELVLLAV